MVGKFLLFAVLSSRVPMKFTTHVLVPSFQYLSFVVAQKSASLMNLE
jgi:hypothetical protein